jgi:glycosyltransferase involved in cell wall biosynthesis
MAQNILDLSIYGILTGSKQQEARRIMVNSPSRNSNALIIILLQIVLFGCQDTFSAPKKPKIVGLIQVRNEERVVEQCLRALACYTDAIVIVNDGSNDKTLSIIRRLAKPLRIEKIVTHKHSSWQVRDERFNRQQLLDAGRDIGGTHYLFMDADEMMSASCMKNQWLRNKILALKKGQLLLAPVVNLWGSISAYRDDALYSPLRPKRDRTQKPIAWCDDGTSGYFDNKSYSKSGIIHISREPFIENKILHKNKYVRYSMINKALLHFHSANLRYIYAKRIWYMCLEFIRLNKKTGSKYSKRNAQTINSDYNQREYKDTHPRYTAHVKVSPTSPSWFKYPFFNAHAFTSYNPIKEREVLLWMKNYGRRYFKNLDIWDVQWLK